MSEEEIIEKSNDYIRLFEKGYCSECNELCSIDNFPNEDLKKLLYAWQSLYKQEKEKNNMLKSKLKEHIKFCETESEGSLHNDICKRSLLFDKSLLKILEEK